MRMSRADNGVLLECKNSGSISPAHDWPVSREPESSEASGVGWHYVVPGPKDRNDEATDQAGIELGREGDALASADSGSRLTAGWEP